MVRKGALEAPSAKLEASLWDRGVAAGLEEEPPEVIERTKRGAS